MPVEKKRPKFYVYSVILAPQTSSGEPMYSRKFEAYHRTYPPCSHYARDMVAYMNTVDQYVNDAVRQGYRVLEYQRVPVYETETTEDVAAMVEDFLQGEIEFYGW